MRVWQQRAPKHQARSEVAKATDSRTDSRARVLDGGQVPHWKPFLFHDRNQGVEHVPQGIDLLPLRPLALELLGGNL